MGKTHRLVLFVALCCSDVQAVVPGKVVVLRFDSTCQLKPMKWPGDFHGAKFYECAKGAPIVEPLQEVNAVVAKLVFSLTETTTEADVAKALVGFPSTVNTEYSYPCTNIPVKTMEWIIPGRADGGRASTKVYIDFLDGRVSHAEWRPTEFLQFSRQFTVVKGGCPPS